MDIEKDATLRRLEDYLRGKVQLCIELLNISLKDLRESPPEFRCEDFQDPIKADRIRKFLILKERYKRPASLILFYLLKKHLKLNAIEIYIHDLVAGAPAWEQGIPGGRDINFIVVVDSKLDERAKSKIREIERYLNYLVGHAISNYFWKKGLCPKNIPFNEMINHNLIEIIIIPPDKKSEFGLNSPFKIIEKLDITWLESKLARLKRAIMLGKMDYLEKYLE